MIDDDDDAVGWCISPTDDKRSLEDRKTRGAKQG